MTYAEAREFLSRLPRFEVKPGLERTRWLLDGLGRPETVVRAVHVAGTNGKGSVVAMLDAVLRAAGYRVGRFTSPEVLDYRDRIAIDGEWISEKAFADLVERLEPLINSMADVPTEFEVLTSMALRWFADQAVDVAVVEVGLGGRFDATNLVRPVLGILTSVDYDHTHLLGESLEAIAWEKAGIAKRGIPLVVGGLPPAAESVVRSVCEDINAPCEDAREIALEREDGPEPPARYRVSGEGLPSLIELPLLGGYQKGNLRLALRAVQHLRGAGFELPDGAVIRGLGGVQWPGRFEIVSRRPDVILEGAHNVAGARALVADLERYVPTRARRHLLFGVLSDKDAAGMARVLFPHFSRVWLTQSSSPRALPARELSGHAAELSVPHTWYDSVREAWATACSALQPNDVLIVAGSLTVVAEARKQMERK